MLGDRNIQATETLLAGSAKLRNEKVWSGESRDSEPSVPPVQTWQIQRTTPYLIPVLPSTLHCTVSTMQSLVGFGAV